MMRWTSFLVRVVRLTLLLVIPLQLVSRSRWYRQTPIQLERCPCHRLLYPATSHPVNTPYNLTTCGRDAYQRGPGQRVAAFSFYGDSRNVHG